MGKKKDRRSYSEEFKANAVKMSLKPGVSVSQVAEELDFSGRLSFPGGGAKPVMPKGMPLRKHEWMLLAKMRV